MICCLVLTIPGYTSLSRARWLGAMVRLPLLVSSVHFKMASKRLEKSICALSRLSEVSLTLLWNGSTVRLIDDGPLSSFQGRSSSAFSFRAFLLQAVDGVVSLALCPQVVSQASQHFRSCEKQATCEGCFARQSICSVVSLYSDMLRAIHPQEFSKVDVDYWHIDTLLMPTWNWGLNGWVCDQGGGFEIWQNTSEVRLCVKSCRARSSGTVLELEGSACPVGLI